MKITVPMAASAPQEPCLMTLTALAVSLSASATVPTKVKRIVQVLLLHPSALHVPVLEASGVVSAFHALGLAPLKEVPTSPHLMRNIIPSLETVAIS